MSNTGEWLVGEISANERRYIGNATLDSKLGYRRGTRAIHTLNARKKPLVKAPQNAADHRRQPIQPTLYLGRTSFSLQLRLARPVERHTISPQDRFAIGGRYTVRGFDGETILSAERGWFVRNDLLDADGCQRTKEIHLGVDYARRRDRAAYPRG